jgi:hypothetical protein
MTKSNNTNSKTLLKKSKKCTTTTMKQKHIINTNYRRPECQDEVWLKGTIIPGKNSDLYRKDVMGSTIMRNKLNSITSKYAWNIDHIIPKSRGGSDDISNLQPMNRADNIRFSNKLTQEKPNYNIKQHHDALLQKSGIVIDNKNNKKPQLYVGQVVYAKQTPVVRTWSFAKIIHINEQNDTVTVNWIDAGYNDILLYHSSLFDTNFTL